MKWSFSGLKKFITCPRQYHEVRVKKTYTEPETQHTLYGHEVHQALEQLISQGIPLPENYSKFDRFMEVILAVPGIKYAELKLAVDDQKRPCDFDGSAYWVRGICDLLISNPPQAYVLDYKTGSDKYADTKQLKLMAALVFHNFPLIQNIKAGLLFLTKEKFVDEEYSRQDLPDLWAVFSNDLRRLEHSYQEDWWPMNPSGLCKKHCVVLDCPANGRS